ncbi:MAG: fibrobacter succinogenes major paralogous domain-containing protein [Bacteroidales bacterium]|nr:fibrobacter succinogenes major paralogous domain-containing protein [Bacteroidales bacterium]
MKKTIFISILIAAFATKSFAHCPIPQWCPDAPLHQTLCPGEQIEEIEFPSVIGQTLIINWWTDGTRFASINTPDGITVSGPPENREHSAPVSIKGAPTVAGTHHYTVSNTCGVELLHGSITVAGPPIIGTVTPTSDQATPQNIPFPSTLTLTDEPIGMQPITIQWYSSTTPSSAAGASGTAVSGATGNTFVPPSDVVNTTGVYYYAVATDRCGRTVTTTNTSGKHIVVPACTPWVGADGCATSGTDVRVTAPGTITWSGNANIETQTWPISGNGIMQVWSGNVRTSTCNARSTWGTDVTNAMSDCCGPTNGFNGDYFTWCFVMRYAATLCPPPWRVPTCQDFINLDIALGGTGYNRWAGGTGDADPASVPSSDKTIEAQIEWYLGASGDGNAAVNNGGTWGGSRFTAFSNDLTSVGSYYWSSSQFLSFGMRAFFMSLTASNVQPRLNGLRNSGFALRCVRDVP